MKKKVIGKMSENCKKCKVGRLSFYDGAGLSPNWTTMQALFVNSL